MSYRFKDNERYAIWLIHGEKCYLCSKKIDLQSMQVDHIIPESLNSDPKKLESVFLSFGLPHDFNLNSYENWLPSCGPCNRKKSNAVFNAVPIIQIWLQNAAGKATKVQETAGEMLSNRQISLALNKVLRAHQNDQLTDDQKNALFDLTEFHREQRIPERKNDPIRLMPLYEVLSNAGGVLTIKGPFGVGGRPSDPSAHSSFNCPNCGAIGAWNGARCVICGELCDD